MFSSSPIYYPSTPSTLRNPLQYRPLNSSPLAESPGKSSPVAAAQARRRSQYKAHAPTTPSQSRTSTGSRNGDRRVDLASYSGGSEEDSQKAFLRGRFKARCFERAVKARDKAISKKRHSEPSSDDYSMDADEEEDDETIMQDELFRRIMANASRKVRHEYRLSYAQEVGSSFDPDMEDINSWERELTASTSANPHGASSGMTSTSTSGDAFWNPFEEEEELTPADLDDEELEVYAEEAAQRAALADFEDIPEDELFSASWSDGEDLGSSTPEATIRLPQDTDMDMS
ncbi:unnamed protein product [Cyclocybe aegerita]|uniref:Uncharacterized protein n=1 Tax=Cyclocybe aegerita TaxID=1973307 RepID=A0A8S0WG51_CYCAE|nr:unnamed protein product [Cyclocybe aegerita]